MKIQALVESRLLMMLVFKDFNRFDFNRLIEHDIRPKLAAIYIQIRMFSSCSLVLKHSLSQGVGVYAGLLTEPWQLIENSVGFAVPNTVLFWNELINYAEALNSTHCLVSFGYYALYNHAVTSEDMSINKFQSKTGNGYYSFEIFTNTEVSSGDQFLSYYGNSWFSDRKMDSDLMEYLDDDPVTLPGCLSNTRITSSKTVVAARKISAGEIIEISRALLLPISQALLSHHSSQLVRYLWWKGRCGDKICPLIPSRKPQTTAEPYHMKYDNRTEYTMLLLGNGAFYGTGVDCKNTSNISDVQKVNSQTSQVNVAYEWWSLSSYLNEVSQKSLEKKVSASSGTVAGHQHQHHVADDGPLSCSTRMFVSFTALRDIDVGEALTIDLSLDTVTNMRFPRIEFSTRCL